MVSWLRSVCRKRHIPVDRIAAFLPLKGAQLLQLSEREFLALEPSFGSFLYRFFVPGPHPRLAFTLPP